MTNFLPQPYTRAMIEAAAHVAKSVIKPGFRNPLLDGAKSKTGAFDLVTEFDEEAERQIRDRLLQEFPYALVTGEERIGRFPKERDELVKAHEAFLIDPIDGTLNFTQGIGAVGTLIAYMQRGVVLAGVLYDPIAGDCVVVERGAGVWFRDEMGVFRALAPVPAHPTQAVMANTWKWQEEGNTGVVQALESFGMVRIMMSAAHDHRTLVLGGGHMALFRDAQPWDHAAGVLAVEELGGRVAFLDGAPYSIARSKGPLLAVSRAQDWEARAQVLRAAVKK